MTLYVGTSGYSYREWKGSFYPEDLPAKGMLRYYGHRFRAVEINNTFHRMPSVALLENWAGQVPPEFLFVLKAPQQITHVKRLKDAGDALAHLLHMAATLKGHLGPLLFQLPPYLRKDLPRLEAFLTQFPPSCRAAFEFRHVSWFDEEVFGLLRAHHAALCIAESEGGLQVPCIATAPWGYLRLRKAWYEDAELEEWVRRVHGLSWKDAFVFFKHEEAGRAPFLAQRFAELAARQGI